MTNKPKEQNEENTSLDPSITTIFRSNILDLIRNEKERINQLQLAMTDQTLFLQNRDPQFQYLRGCKGEIENQIVQLETLLENSDNK